MKYLLAIAAMTPLTLNAAERDETQVGVSIGTPGAINVVIKKEISGILFSWLSVMLVAPMESREAMASTTTVPV